MSVLSSAAGFGALTPAAAGAPSAVPHFALPEPDDHKSSLISGSITTLIHGAILAVLIVLGWNAPVVEELIQVKLIRELPGSDEEPAPARKILKPRQRRPIQASAQRVATQAVAQPRVIRMTAEQLRMAKLNQAVAPTEVRRRQVTSTRTEARSIDTRRVSAIDLSQFDEVVIVPTDLAAPIIDYDGPREIDRGAAVQAPENFAAVPNVRDVDYSSAAPVEVISDADLQADTGTYDFDTNVGVYAGGEGTGGTGTAVGVVRCMESAFVHRYLDLVTERTEKRWRVPKDAADDARVVLEFVLDSSGAATRVEFRGDTQPQLGNSAIAALHAASPFPPMDDNVRCLAGKKLSGTFSVEAL